MVSVSTTSALPLLPILQRAFPDIVSYQVEDTIVQASATGFRISCTTTTAAASTSSDNSSINSRELFVKCVEASHYSNRPWGDLRRALLYSRTEARFYSDILPMLQENLSSFSLESVSASGSEVESESGAWDIAPKCYLAESYLQDLIEENESTAAKLNSNTDLDPKYGIDDDAILRDKGGNLILESLHNTYYQTSPLTLSQASQCLSAAAKFHAAAFEKSDILREVSDKLCANGGSYHLANRNPKELRELRSTWDDIVSNIEGASPEGFFEREEIRNIGQRIYDVAEYVSEQLSPSYGDKYATIVHGDYKAMNVFLPIQEDAENAASREECERKREPLLIDFASVGVGIGASDVAMHIPHAIIPRDLENGGEEQLVNAYYEAFQDALHPSKRHLYTKEDFLRHYRFATVDYFRFIVGRMWKGLSMEVFEKRKKLKNFAEFNRSLDAALAFITRADKYLVEIEKEMEQNM